MVKSFENSGGLFASYPFVGIQTEINPEIMLDYLYHWRNYNINGGKH